MSVKSVKVDDFEKSTIMYFDEIKNTKPLSKKEERLLWKNFREHKDMSARERLIKANLKFVPTVAKQFKGCGLPFADIIEEGNIGLIKAIDRFDPKRDNKVISYAVWWIRKCILEAIEKKGMLDTENIDDIHTNINDNDDDIQENNNPVKLITPEKIDFEDNSEYSFNIKQIVEELFDGVPERERSIVSDYYGLYGDSPKTLDEIGIEINLTKERVRQLNEKALKKMRSNALLKNITITSF
jgi:RNA polymerase primary sigma factor